MFYNAKAGYVLCSQASVTKTNYQLQEQIINKQAGKGNYCCSGQLIILISQQIQNIPTIYGYSYHWHESLIGTQCK